MTEAALRKRRRLDTPAGNKGEGQRNKEITVESSASLLSQVAESLPVIVDNMKKYEEAISKIELDFRFIRVSFSQVPRSRQFDPSEKRALAQENGWTTESFSASRRLFTKEELADANRVLAEARTLVHAAAVTMAYPLPGVRAVRHDYVDTLISGLDDCRQRLTLEANKLEERLPAIIELKKQSKLFRESDYNFKPSQFYNIEYTWVSVSPPEWLQDIKYQTLQQRERGLMLQSFVDMIQDEQERIMEELFVQVSEVCNNLQSFAQPGKERDERRVLRKARFDNIANLCDQVSAQVSRYGLFDNTVVTVCNELKTILRLPEDAATSDDKARKMHDMIELIRRRPNQGVALADTLERMRRKLFDLPELHRRRRYLSTQYTVPESDGNDKAKSDVAVS